MQARTDIRAIVQPIMRLAFSIEKIADRKLRKTLDLSVSQFRMLMVIRRAGEVRQRDIAEYWGVAEASVSRQIETLRRRHIIARRPNPANRREHVIALTPAGAAIIARAARAMGKELESTFASVPGRERAALVSGLGRLLAAFQESCCGPAADRQRTPASPRARAGLR